MAARKKPARAQSKRKPSAKPKARKRPQKPSTTDAFTLMVPPSYAALPDERRAEVVAFLSKQTDRPARLTFARSYDELSSSLLSGDVNAAWAPPFACARLEHAGVPILARAVRAGRTTYRAALVCRADRPLTLEGLVGTRAAWVDRESVAGYLLIASWLREHGLDPDRTFTSQRFLGSYPAVLQAVLDGESDVCSVFAPPASLGDTLLLDEFAPGAAERLRPLFFTGEAPNDGIALAPSTSPKLRTTLERAFLGAHQSAAGRAVLHGLFRVDRFDRAPVDSYVALSHSVQALR